MPPIRRYVRISPHSCLEVRIFLENPSDVTTWLLRPSNPALPRVFNAVRPLILPKLKEENERARLTKGKSGKKRKGVKDVVKGDDFEVVVFLTEGQGRHEVVVKRREAEEARFGAASGTGGSHKDEPVVIREEDDDDRDMDINVIPAAADDSSESEMTAKRARNGLHETDEVANNRVLDTTQDEKKKLGFKTRYDGFSIWGKVLCLLVERKGGPTKRSAGGRNSGGMVSASFGISSEGSGSDPGAQQALMQEWISSTQLPLDDDEEEDDG